jgi:hypothetical protein
MYIYFINTDKDFDLLRGRPVLPSGRMPHDNTACLDYSQNLAMSPIGAQCQDGLTDRPTDRLTVSK